MSSSVGILLSTYNGEAFLAELLDSILAQTHREWTLICRDDHSQDHTLDILKSYAARDPRIVLHDQIRANVGVVRSFGILLPLAIRFDVVLFCDQDDIWLPQKLARFVEEFGKRGPAPLALHCDLEVMSHDGKSLAPSFRARVGLPTTVETFWPLLARNFITGCALGMNQALVKLAVPIAKDTLMHDWWVGLIAKTTGDIGVIDDALVRYRQHAHNASGAMAEFGLLNKVRRRIFKPSYFRSLMMRRFRQSLALEQHLRTLGRQSLADELSRYHQETAAGRRSAVRAGRSRGVQLYGPLRTFLYFSMLAWWQPRIARLIRLQNSLQRSS